MTTRSQLHYVPRRPSRHAVRLACQVVRERDFKLVADELIELSEHGMVVRPKLRLLTGEELLVSFMAPFTRNFVDAEATVARVIHGRRLGDGGLSLGLEISAMDEAARAMIRSQLAFIPSAAPRRRVYS